MREKLRDMRKTPENFITHILDVSPYLVSTNVGKPEIILMVNCHTMGEVKHIATVFLQNLTADIIQYENCGTTDRTT